MRVRPRPAAPAAAAPPASLLLGLGGLAQLGSISRAGRSPAPGTAPLPPPEWPAVPAGVCRLHSARRAGAPGSRGQALQGQIEELQVAGGTQPLLPLARCPEAAWIAQRGEDIPGHRPLVSGHGLGCLPALGSKALSAPDLLCVLGQVASPR